MAKVPLVFDCARLTFTHKVVAQYVFMQWHTSFVDLPQWCNRTLAPDAVLRASVGATQVGGVGFTSPDKGKNGGRPISPASHPTLDKLLLVFTKKLEREEEVMQGEAQEKVKVDKMAAIQRCHRSH
jgi:hypothetical protein